MPIGPKSLTVPLDHRRRLDQHHRVQTTRPPSVEPDPEQAICRKQPVPTRSLATKNVQQVTEGEVFQFQNGPTTESEGKNRDDGTYELKHAGDTTAAHSKTLFGAFGVFSSHSLMKY